MKNFQVNKVYNRIYIGENKSYKFSDGDMTFRIEKISNDGEIQYKALYPTYPTNVSTSLLERNTTYVNLDYIIESQFEYIYKLVDNPNDYIIHSRKMTMNEAINFGYVDLDLVKHTFRDQSKNHVKSSPIVSHDWGNYFSLQLSAIKKSDTQYLQTIVFVWESIDEMKKDVLSVYDKAWFI